MPLTPAQKREFTARFVELKRAIDTNDPQQAERYLAFRSVYDGPSTSYVNAFEKAHDKSIWVGQLELYLSEQIEPEFWNPDQLASSGS